MLEELNVAYVAFSPMANGFLTAQYTPSSVASFDASTDYRASMPQYTEEGFEHARALLDMLSDLAENHKATAAQISLAWMLCKKPYIIPIPGSRKPERLHENLHAADVTLSANEIAQIDIALDHMDLLVFGSAKLKG